VLGRVLRGEQFAAAALDEALFSCGLNPADRALATELTYGVLRTRGALLAQLNTLAKQGDIGVEPRVLDHLLVAAYQLSFLERVPAFAAVNEAVELVRAISDRRVTGFCNAVLRRYAALPKLELGRAVLQSAPSWLSQALTEAVGVTETRLLLGGPDATGELYAASASVRLRSGVPRPDWLDSAVPGRLYSEAYRVSAGGDLRRSAAYLSGHVVVQDEGSMFAAHALGAKAGERVLDACAGRGHKSSLLAERVGQHGVLWVADRAASKLRALSREFERLSLPTPECRVVDFSEPSPDLPSDFDRVLVDAPCTGTGTLRKRPEISLRLQPDDVERLAQLAERILRSASAHVKPGGRVLFVVCSVLARENEQLVARVADVLTPAPFDIAHPAIAPGATQLRLLPGEHGTDGFFLASFVRRASS
jgi:16S rRNA (cytosine967-C5)-methyltransferase